MNPRRAFWLTLIVLLACLIVAPVLASSSAVDTSAYALIAWTTAPGGQAQGGAFTLEGTAGQPAAGALSAGSLTVNGGFWQHDAGTNALYLASIRK